MQESRTSNALKNSAATLLYKVAHIVMQFVLRTAFVRLLGNEYTGISTLFTDILSVLSLLELGMASAMLYALYKPMAEGNELRVSALMNFYKRAYTIIGFLVLIVGLLCIPFLGYIVTDVPNIKEDIRILFVMFVMNSALSYFLVYKTSLLRADQKARVISTIDVYVQGVETVIEVVLLLIFKEYVAYLIVHLIATVIRNLILSGISQKRYGLFLRHKESRLSLTETKSLYKDILALGIYKISGVIIYSTESIIISAFIGTVEVAIIGNFRMIVTAVRQTVEQIVTAIRPSIGNLAAVSSKEKQEEIFNIMNFLCFWIACFCCSCFFVLLNPFVGSLWFDSNYMIDQKLITMMTINFFIAIMVFPVESFRTANGLFVQGQYRPAIMAVMNIVLSLIFVQKWGVFGVYLATFVSRVLTQCWFDPYLVYKHVFKIKPWSFYKTYLTHAMVTVICCAVAYMLANVLTIENRFLLFGYQMIVAAIVPNVMMVLLYHRTKEFRSICGMGLRMLKKLVKN